jgi:VanZ family protein
LALPLHRRASGLIAALCILLLVTLSLVPGDERPHTGYSGRYEHFAAYFLTAIPMWFACASRNSRVGAMLGLSALAGILEVLQLWIPGRNAAVLDWAMSSAGGASGMLISSVLFFAVSRGNSVLNIRQ